MFNRENAQRVTEAVAQAHDRAVEASTAFLDTPSITVEGVPITRRQALVGTVVVLGEVALASYAKGQMDATSSQADAPVTPTFTDNAPITPASPSIPRVAPGISSIGVDVTPVPRPVLAESDVARDRRHELAKKLENEFPLMESQKDLEPSTLPFLDDDANEAAKETGITHVGELFDIPPSVLPHLKAWLSDEKLKIFSPGVDKHDMLFDDKAAKYPDVSGTFLRTLAQIESGGDEDAGPEDGSDGQGLMQVEDGNFEVGDSREKKKEPAYNMDRAITHVIRNYKRRAENETLAWNAKNGSYKASDTYKWLRIAQGYNGGNIGIETPSAYDTDKRLSYITKIYFDHVLRFAVIAEIASKLKAKGFDDAQVAAKLTSYEVAARAKGLEEALLEEGSSNYSRYQEIKSVLGEAHIDTQKASQIRADKGKTLDQVYREDLQNTNDGVRNIQINPALRIWLSHDPSRGLWGNMNNALDKWQEMYAHAGIKVWKPVTPTPGPAKPEQKPAFKPEQPVAKPERPLPETGKKIIPDAYIYNERDKSWWSVPGDEELTCGSVSIAMTASTLLGRRITPTEVDQKLQREGLRTVQGTIFRIRRNEFAVAGKEEGAVEFIRDEYGLTVEQFFDRDSNKKENSAINLKKWKEAIDAGQIIIASATNTMFVKDKLADGTERFPNGADHIFVIEDVDVENETMTVVDPWNGVRREDISVYGNMRGALYAYGVGQ